MTVILNPSSPTRVARVAEAIRKAMATERVARGHHLTLSPYRLHHHYGGPTPAVIGTVLRKDREALETAVGRRIDYTQECGGMWVTIRGAA